MNNSLVENLIELAIREDLGSGDHTSHACLQKDTFGEALIVAKEPGIVAGIQVAELLFKKFDTELSFNAFLRDGDSISVNQKILKISGSTISILSAERLVLNFMQRMSGIATQTATYVAKVKDLPVKILDTRKTSPGLRYFEKWAVRIGGGYNHRFGLYDYIMIKDNHIDFAGGIPEAIEKTVRYLKDQSLSLAIEVETRNMAEVQQVLDIGKVQRIMLDNFNVASTRAAVELINHKFEVESSGGITLNNVRDYALCGVDFISVGALTHQIHSLDLSMNVM